MQPNHAFTMVPTESSYRADLNEQRDCVKADFVDNAVVDVKIVHSHTQAQAR